MEFLCALGIAIVGVPIGALLQAPFVRLAARVAKTAPVSFRAAFMLGLITGAAMLAISLVLYPFNWVIGEGAADGLSSAACTAAGVWLYGYFLRDEAGNSVGIKRGFVAFALGALMVFGALLLVDVLSAPIIDGILKGP